MAINLTKGGNINLTKTAPSLTNVRVELGWDVSNSTSEFDLDAVAILLDANNKAKDSDVVFFNNKVSSDKSVYTEGDDRTGEGEGPDEIIHVDLTKVSAEIQQVSIAVVIYEAVERRQNFGQVNNAYIKIVDDKTNEVLAEHDLDENSSMDTAMIFGILYRNNGDWKFKAVDTGSVNSLAALVTQFGVAI